MLSNQFPRIHSNLSVIALIILFSPFLCFYDVNEKTAKIFLCRTDSSISNEIMSDH